MGHSQGAENAGLALTSEGVGRFTTAAKDLPLVLGVRPEDIAFVEAGTPGSLPVMVVVVELLGAENIINVNLAVTNPCDRLHQTILIESGSNRDGSGQGEDENLVECVYDLPRGLTVTKACPPCPVMVKNTRLPAAMTGPSWTATVPASRPGQLW